MSTLEIQQVANGLSARERGQLVLWLLDALPPHAEGEAIGESVEEAVRRRDQVESAGVKMISAEAFWTSVDAERAEWK